MGTNTTLKPGRPPLYPWQEWLDLCKHEEVILTRGKDFDCEPYSMASQARRAAQKLGFSGIRVKIKIDCIRVSTR